MKHRGTKILSLLLTLVLVLGLMPGMSLTALAYDGNPYVSLVGTTTSVTFNGKPWYIIADNSTAVGEGTVTLLAANTSFGLSAFSDSLSNNYSNSKVKASLDALTTSGSFKDVADAIVNNTDAGGKLYLLSTSEAQALSSDVLKMGFSSTSGGWWLRSPSYVSMAAVVYGEDGDVDDYGSYVDESFGVRPALKLNLSSVIFDSVSKEFSLKPAGYTVSFDPNGGDGTMDDVTDVSGSYTLPGCGFDPPEGQSFKAWSLDGTEYAPGAPINIGRDTTFVAIWQAAASGGAVGFGGGGDDGWYGGYVTGLRAYRVSLAPMQGGSAALVLNTGESGTEMNVYPQTTVRVVPSPAPGYKLASIVWSLIDGSASYDITQSQTFVMPAMDAVVHVTFVPVG